MICFVVIFDLFGTLEEKKTTYIKGHGISPTRMLRYAGWGDSHDEFKPYTQLTTPIKRMADRYRADSLVAPKSHTEDRSWQRADGELNEVRTARGCRSGRRRRALCG